ncbi:MAG: hypothetical protein IJO24_09030 [Clostridia bacterium]|nr:hypothetical protein [Clostridia bacterium]
MKKKIVLSMVIIASVFLSSVVAFFAIEHKANKTRVDPYASYYYLIDEVADLRSTFAEMFSQNQEIFISIAEQLYGEDIGIIVYDSENETAKYVPQNMDKNLILECFKIMEERDFLDSTLRISAPEINGEYPQLRFAYRVPKIDIDVGIMYSEQDLSDYTKLCDNWYIFQHGLV